MANTLTNLFPDLYAALDIVSRELVGFIPAVRRDSNIERAAVGETVRVPVTTEESAQDITPGVNAPDNGDTTVDNRPVQITRQRGVGVRFNGEETRGLQNADTYATIRRDRFAQAMRELVNEIEADLAGEAIEASQGYGEAGTTPFGTKDDFSDFAGVAQVLDSNGAPMSDRQLVAGSQAWFNLRGTQTGVLQRTNEAGTDEALRMGEFGQVNRMTLRNSAQVANHTSGTLTDVTANDNPVGITQVDVETSGSSGDISLNKGDLISIAGDDNLYTVAEDTSEGSGVTTTVIPINEPGLAVATSDGDAVSAQGDYIANVGFHRNALQLATRAPALPEGGDEADDRTVVQDPVSGLAFEVSVYRQYRQVRYEVAMAWGYKATKPEHMALLLG